MTIHSGDRPLRCDVSQAIH